MGKLKLIHNRYVDINMRNSDGSRLLFWGVKVSEASRNRFAKLVSKVRRACDGGAKNSSSPSPPPPQRPTWLKLSSFRGAITPPVDP